MLRDGLPIAELLWESCRAVPRPPEVSAALDALDDPSAAVDAAVAHRLEGLLWRALEHAGRPGALGKAGQRLAHLAHLRRYEATTLLPHALGLAVGPLLAAGLKPMVFKGPSLAERYPEPGLRPMADIDLLLPRPDRARALSLLAGAGWRVLRPAGRAHHDTVLSHPEVPGLALELHHDLATWDQRANRLTGKLVWRWRVEQECLGLPVFALPPEEELVALAAHAGKPYHCFGRLIWVADLVVVAGAASSLDWGRVGHRASGLGCRTVVAVALSQAARAGLESPETLRRVPAQRLAGGPWNPCSGPSGRSQRSRA